MPNDGHYSPLSDAGARSMKLRHFSPERGEGLRAGGGSGRGGGGMHRSRRRRIKTAVKSQRVKATVWQEKKTLQATIRRQNLTGAIFKAPPPGVSASVKAHG